MILLLSLISFVHIGYSSYVDLTCERNCDATAQRINGGEGQEVKLKYIISVRDFSVVHFFYDKTNIISFAVQAGLVFKSKPDFISFKNTKLHDLVDRYEFSFEVLKLNRSFQDSEFRSALTLRNLTVDKLNKRLNIWYAPELLAGGTQKYTAEENSTISITYDLTGNPKPIVRAHLDGEDFTFKWDGKYKYTLLLKNVSRSLCGRNLDMVAVGYMNKKVSESSTVYVLFTPDIPTRLKTFRSNDSCWTVKWFPVESGICSINYTLNYAFATTTNLTEHFAISTNHSKTQLCFSAINTTYSVALRIKAAFRNHSSGYSDTFNFKVSPVRPPSPVESHSSAVIFIVVGVVIALTCCAIFVVLFRKGNLKFCERRPLSKKDSISMEPNVTFTECGGQLGTVNDGMESDYVQIGNIKPNTDTFTQSTDYAELGPGGRTEVRQDAVEPSTYAQVNTDKAYYPSLNPQAPKREPEPEYAVSSKP